MLKLYNTLTRQKEEFRPIIPDEVRMYNCGPTVYNYAHLGNLRSYVLADLLRRTFEYHNFSVHHVINITDVGHLTDDSSAGQDKIEESAKIQNKSVEDIADFYTDSFFKDLDSLNIIREPIKFPRATKHITEMIELISILEKKGAAYQTPDGVYFDITKFSDYGILGNISLEDQQEGARVEINRDKRNPADFALWKFSEPHEKRQQEWESPWGLGYPGWHIECSAMSMKYLGAHFDIHTGGIDHIAIHHNNEIAQSETATEKPFVNYWLHNEFITIKGGKMAKSEGNFLTLQSVMKKSLHPLAYRLFLLAGHYRSPLTFSFEALQGSHTALMRLAKDIHNLGTLREGAVNTHYKTQFEEAINDDLNTPQALAVLWELMKDDTISPETKRTTALFFDQILGLNLETLSNSFNEERLENIPIIIQSLADEREKARENNDFEKADELRDKIAAEGFEVKDTENGPNIQKSR